VKCKTKTTKQNKLKTKVVIRTVLPIKKEKYTQTNLLKNGKKKVVGKKMKLKTQVIKIRQKTKKRTILKNKEKDDCRKVVEKLAMGKEKMIKWRIGEAVVVFTVVGEIVDFPVVVVVVSVIVDVEAFVAEVIEEAFVAEVIEEAFVVEAIEEAFVVEAVEDVIVEDVVVAEDSLEVIEVVTVEAEVEASVVEVIEASVAEVIEAIAAEDVVDLAQTNSLFKNKNKKFASHKEILVW